MAHKWTEEEIKILTDNCTIGATKIHSLLPNIPVSAIRYKLKSVGLNKVKKYNWTEEELNILKLECSIYTAKELAIKLNRSVEAIRMQLSRQGLSAKKDKKGPAIGSIKNTLYTDEYFIYILQGLSITSHDWYVLNKLPEWPAANTISKRFGGWTKALEAAGIKANKGVQSPDRSTLVYLLDFGDFYKVGITQQSIKQRFTGYPEYDIIAYKSTSLEEAKSIEKAVLNLVAEYKFIPNTFPTEGRGFTECFKASAPILSQCLVYFQDRIFDPQTSQTLSESPQRGKQSQD